MGIAQPLTKTVLTVAEKNPGEGWARVNTWNVSPTMSVCVSFGGLIFTVSQKKTPGEGLKYIPGLEKSPAASGAGDISEMYWCNM